MSIGSILVVNNFSREILANRAILIRTETGASLSPASYRTKVLNPTFNIPDIID
jgi:hypothetical protein